MLIRIDVPSGVFGRCLVAGRLEDVSGLLVHKGDDVFPIGLSVMVNLDGENLDKLVSLNGFRHVFLEVSKANVILILVESVTKTVTEVRCHGQRIH